MTLTVPERMRCMEVWGGNQAVERAFQTAGLNVWVYSRPFGRSTSGGDVYYLSSCASGRVTRMLLADVSGHGEKVSRMAVGLRDLMRQNVNYVQQTRFVRAMNRQFLEFGEQDRFATVLVSTFFAPTQMYALSNAGHPMPVVYRRSSGWTTLTIDAAKPSDPTNTPLGIIGKATYSQLNMRLETGDMVLSFSDAVTESEDGFGRQLGTEGVLTLLRAASVTAAEDVIPSLVDRISCLAPSNLKLDDATLLLCQATGDGPSLRNQLLAPVRFFGPVADRTNLGPAPGMKPEVKG